MTGRARGPGVYSLGLEVNTAVEMSRRVKYIHDLWSLDAAEVFPGLRIVPAKRPPSSRSSSLLEAR